MAPERKELKGAPFTRGDFRAAANDNFETLFSELAALKVQMSDTFGATHTIASHNDTSATGAQLDAVVQNVAPTDIHGHNSLRGDTNFNAVKVSDVSSTVDISASYGLWVKSTLQVNSSSTFNASIDVTGPTGLYGTVILQDAFSQTTDPHVTGQLWREGSTLKISLG